MISNLINSGVAKSFDNRLGMLANVFFAIVIVSIWFAAVYTREKNTAVLFSNALRDQIKS